MPSDTPQWQIESTHELAGRRVGLTAPRLVARSRGYLWFTSMARFDDGNIVATISDYKDENIADPTQLVTVSRDGGWSWAEPVRTRFLAESFVLLPDGDMLLLPYHSPRVDDGTDGPYHIVRKGSLKIEEFSSGVTVTGWERPLALKNDTQFASFAFNGDTARVAGDRYLAPLYGRYADDSHASIVCAVSDDGFHWTVRSTIADDSSALDSPTGPSESAISRLRDGRLLVVFRLGGFRPMAKAYSSDEGQTWTTPEKMTAMSVQPSLATLTDGSVWLTTGRPGIFLWLNADGAGDEWESIDLMAHHNACCDEQIVTGANADEWSKNRSSCYTEIIALDDRSLLCIYDRIANSWFPIPDDMDDTNSVWVMRIECL